jgi:ribosomal protein S18 acetylase RimI-like enzyme
MENDIQIRSALRQEDLAAIRDILQSSGFFYEYEITTALEVAEENLKKGDAASGYSFMIVERKETPLAFVCYGKAACTVDSYELYWLAVHQQNRGGGLGRMLMLKTEEVIRRNGGKKIWIETSSRPLYEPTRIFYRKNGYDLIAELPEFYAYRDNKCIFLKKL